VLIDDEDIRGRLLWAENVRSTDRNDNVRQIATDAAKLCKKLEPTLTGTDVRYEYSPESFTGTEVDYAIEICAAVSDVIDAMGRGSIRSIGLGSVKLTPPSVDSENTNRQVSASLSTA